MPPQPQPRPMHDDEDEPSVVGREEREELEHEQQLEEGRERSTLSSMVMAMRRVSGQLPQPMPYDAAAVAVAVGADETMTWRVVKNAAVLVEREMVRAWDEIHRCRWFPADREQISMRKQVAMSLDETRRHRVCVPWLCLSQRELSVVWQVG